MQNKCKWHVCSQQIHKFCANMDINVIYHPSFAISGRDRIHDIYKIYINNCGGEELFKCISSHNILEYMENRNIYFNQTKKVLLAGSRVIDIWDFNNFIYKEIEVTPMRVMENISALCFGDLDQIAIGDKEGQIKVYIMDYTQYSMQMIFNTKHNIRIINLLYLSSGKLLCMASNKFFVWNLDYSFSQTIEIYFNLYSIPIYIYIHKHQYIKTLISHIHY